MHRSRAKSPTTRRTGFPQVAQITGVFNECYKMKFTEEANNPNSNNCVSLLLPNKPNAIIHADVH